MANGYMGKNHPFAGSFSVLEGVMVKIGDKFQVPKKVTLPIDLRLVNTSHVTTKFDFSLEENVIKKAKEERDQQIAISMKENEQLMNENKTSDEETKANISDSQAEKEELNENETIDESHVASMADTPILEPTQIYSSSVTEKKSNKSPERFNLSEFEDSTATPFELVELQTLDDIDELKSVLQPETSRNKKVSKAAKKPAEVELDFSIFNTPSVKTESNTRNEVATASLLDGIGPDRPNQPEQCFSASNSDRQMNRTQYPPVPVALRDLPSDKDMQELRRQNLNIGNINLDMRGQNMDLRCQNVDLRSQDVDRFDLYSPCSESFNNQKKFDNMHRFGDYKQNSHLERFNSHKKNQNADQLSKSPDNERYDQNADRSAIYKRNPNFERFDNFKQRQSAESFDIYKGELHNTSMNERMTSIDVVGKETNLHSKLTRTNSKSLPNLADVGVARVEEGTWSPTADSQESAASVSRINSIMQQYQFTRLSNNENSSQQATTQDQPRSLSNASEPNPFSHPRLSSPKSKLPPLVSKSVPISTELRKGYPFQNDSLMVNLEMNVRRDGPLKDRQHKLSASSPSSIVQITSPSTAHTPVSPSFLKETRPTLPPVALKSWLPDPSSSLTAEESKFMQRMVIMGFPRARVARAVQKLNNKEKEVLDLLVEIQQIADKGYDPDDVEVALENNNNEKDKVISYLELSNKWKELGFPQQKIHDALKNTDRQNESIFEYLTR